MTNRLVFVGERDMKEEHSNPEQRSNDELDLIIKSMMNERQAKLNAAGKSLGLALLYFLMAIFFEFTDTDVKSFNLPIVGVKLPINLAVAFLTVPGCYYELKAILCFATVEKNRRYFCG